jgi:hypothetical protein
VGVTRKNVEFAKRIFTDRIGDPYVYGGTWNPFDLSVGCDCSGLVTDILSATFDGTAMPWDREGLSTESYRYKPMGQQQVGPFTLMHVSSPDQIPANAVMRIDLHHEGEGGPDSHMHCVLDGLVMESNGDHGTCTLPQAISPDSSYWNDWWYVPGPIVEDGVTPLTPVPAAGLYRPGASAPPTPGEESGEPQDTLFADVSEFQVPVNDSYPYQVLSIRVCDGTYQDHNFAENYAWMKRALDDGRLAMGIVYTYVRPGWPGTVNTVRSMINDNGGLHPKVVIMLDVESGGNPNGDGSSWINATYNDMVNFTGDPRRVIGYGNVGDLNSIWLSKPPGIRLIIAGYGANPSYPGKIAHQYTDGNGYGGGLPEGCPPFGNCDMNSADGLSPSQFAATCGIDSAPLGGFLMALSDAQQQEIYDKITTVWGSRSPFRRLGEGPVDDTVGFLLNEDSNEHIQLIIKLAEYGDPGALGVLNEVANADPVKYPDRQGDAALARRVLDKLQSAPVAPTASVAAPLVAPVAEPASVAPAATEGAATPAPKSTPSLHEALDALLAAFPSKAK